MKKSKAVLGLCLAFGIMLMIPMGCSDSDSVSPVPANVPTNRVYILNADTATLVPSASAANGITTGDSQQSWEYTLTLENVSEEMFWFTDRPERHSGNEKTEYFFQTVWPAIYISIAPNGILDGTIPPNTLNDGLYLMLQNPVYNPNLKQVVFNVTLQNTTMDDKHPAGSVSFENVKVTIADNNQESGVVEWSFVQAGPLATLEPEGTEGTYILTFENIYPECYYVSLAPDRYSFTYTVALLTDTWNNHFGNVPPNASITSYDSNGQLQVHVFTLENPVYDSDTGLLTYRATVLENEAEPGPYLYTPTLFIDGSPTASCDSGFTGRFTVHNGSTGSIWLVETAPVNAGYPEVAQQWDWWKNKYGEKYQITGGQTVVFCVPDAGAPGGNFRFRMGCDKNGDNCILGDATGFMAGINTLFEPSFGCKLNQENKKAIVPGCAFNPAANKNDFPDFPHCVEKPNSQNCPSIGGTDYFDVSTVDGYTIPLLLAVKGSNCNRTTTDASMLDIASCPSDGKATLYSENEKQNEVIQKPAGVSWLTKDDKEYLRGCVAPCHWFTGGGIGDPENPDPTSPLPGSPPWAAANYYCCQGISGGSGPQAGASECVEGPSDGTRVYPITLTNYVKTLKAVGYKGYTWQYDDLEGTMTCDWGEQIFLTLVPDGGVPYDPATKWAYSGGTCSAGKKGSYASLVACQQANMKYVCKPEAYKGLTVNYCVVDPQGTMTWEECKSSQDCSKSYQGE